MRFLWSVAAVLLVASASEAQRDPLDGKWEGALHIDGRDRILIIENVGEKIAFGYYGYSGGSLGGVKIEVDRSGTRPSISFVTWDDLRVRLTLVNERLLAGNVHLPKQHVGFGLQDWHLTLGKVE